MAVKTIYRFLTLLLACVLSAFLTKAIASPSQIGKKDTTPRSSDTTRYPIYDRYGDPFTYPNRNSFNLKDTGFIKRNIQYDPVTKQYYIIEKVGDQYYRVPATLTMQDFLRMQGTKDENDYFRQRADLLTDLNRRTFKPKFGFSKDWMNRITGNSKVEIHPMGYIDVLAGYQGQNIKNPTLPEQARKTGGFDFNEAAQMQVDAKIGDKINLPINYNTLSTFDYENQIKLDYHGKDDEILKQFQMGTISFQTKSTLIPGIQSLFGIKSQLQFGKLFVTGALANQRSQRQTLGLQGGSATQTFSIRADEYEENRHFLLAQYFRNNYNKAMSQLPIVHSNVQILRVEVWVTNRTGIVSNTGGTDATAYRDVVGFMDLGENNPFNPKWTGSGNTLPSNSSNNLYQTLLSDPNARISTQVQTELTAMGLQQVQDFEKTFARKLQPNEFYFNPQIGFISLNQPLQPDDVLGVAFQYTYNGRVYQVGEFSQDVPPDSTGSNTKVLFLKLLKATAQRPYLPIWGLMMKNVYSVGYGQLQRDGFDFNIVYDQPSFGQKRYLPPAVTSSNIQQGTPLLTLDNLDRLNNQNDPQPDGVFDYVEGFTVISSQSRVIFPVLEPFGHDLDYAVQPAYRDSILFYPLYDTIKAIAQNYANLDRFLMVGKSKSTSTGDYQLGLNIPRGSVVVTAGGQILQENVDYEINYDLGTLRIINQAILNSGVPVQVQFENNATFGLQQKNFMGLRLDYLANKNLSLGATMERLGERPFFTKQAYGEDPIRNTMYGLDFDYHNEVPRLTKWLDKLPFYSTKTVSTISAYGEAAALKPGHAPEIGSGSAGAVYIDDFEGTRSTIDLRFPLISWTLASVPQNAPDGNGGILFPEGSLQDDLSSGYNRAKLAWYNIEPVLQEKDNPDNPFSKNLTELSKPETRQVFQSEIFPNKTTDIGQGLLTTFDLAFYPQEKGPYNFRTSNLNANGNLLNPKKSWGGIMRSIDQTDFVTSNITFIEFWVQDPFINKPNNTGGELYFQLGNISEDVLRDGKRQYENGLPTPTNNAPVDTTVWGQVPRNPIQVTNAFSNNPADRPYQDVGFDGLTDTAEQRYFQPYLNTLGSTYGTGSVAYQNAFSDPSNDNFRGYRDAYYDKTGAGILERYKKINNPQGNSPIATATDQFTSAFTLYPDQEDLNRDNTMNEDEEYFQYRVDLHPGMNPTNNKYITDVRTAQVHLADGSTRTENWYLFRIPIADTQTRVGQPDLKSIRFIRMFLTDFSDSATVLRFAELQLVRDQWRKFTYETDTTGKYTTLPANDPTSVDLTAVNIEENDQRSPIPYREPPGVLRQQEISNNNVPLLLNEQSLSVKFCNLLQSQSRGVFKTLPTYDLRSYGQMSMFIHAEDSRAPGTNIKDNDLKAVIRIGSDFVSNYYEIRIPLKITPWGVTDSLSIWPAQNNLDFDLTKLTTIKVHRNNSNVSTATFYSETGSDGRTYAIIGNPNLGEVQGIFMGVENDGPEPVCTELWFDELRLSKLNESGGYAALGRVDLRLADLGNVSMTASYHSVGWGTLEQRVNERAKEDLLQYDISTNIDLGKLVPKKAAVQIPVFASVSKTISTPQYDPFDLDLLLTQKLNSAPNAHMRDSMRAQAIDETTIKTINFTNVKKNKTNGKKPQPWDISNINLNYSFVHQQSTNPLIEENDVKRTNASVAYNYAPQPNFVEPFKKWIKSRSPWLSLIRDFNFNYKPSLFSVKANVFRQFGALRSRNIGTSFELPETFNKYFYFDRYYSMRWDFTRSISLDFNAVNNARVDEPDGRLDTKAKRDTVKNNFLSGGRNTHYHQEATLTYNLPTSKLPLLDWTNIRASYTAKYDWLAGTLLDRDLGNTITNGQTRNITGDFDFDRLYNKWKFLRAVNSDAQPNFNPNQNQQPKNAKDTSAKHKKIKDPNALPQIGTVPKFFLRLATSLKRIGIQYNEDMGTLLPGYMDSTQVLGMNLRSMNPGWKYVFGYQPDTSAINSLARRGLLSRDSLFNALIQQRYNQHISVTAQLSPIRDLNIDITFDKTFDKQYSELDKDTTGHSGIQRFNPYATGSFSMSFISFQTLFQKFNPEQVSATFQKFEANRAILSKRLGELNPYNGGSTTGYGLYAQDVLIPSFIAAYTNKDPTTVTLIKNSNPNLSSNPFSGFFPLPNWNIVYSGLSRLPGLQKIFTNVTIRHGYSSTLGMNSFTTALLFQDPLHTGYPYFIDTLTHNYVPYFLIPNITITEQFTPLIGIDATFTNQLTTHFEYKRSRSLSLSLVDYQLAENRSNEYTFGLDWRKRGVPFLKNISIGKKGKKLNNDVTFHVAFNLRDDATANTSMAQNISYGTAGQEVIGIHPSIDYVMSNRINIKLYFDQDRTIPKIATTAPITITRAGIQIRISLAQ